MTQALPTEQIFEAFKKWINQRPGLDKADYGFMGEKDRKLWWQGYHAYQEELRGIAKQGREARKALAEALRYPFDAQAMQQALERTFSGRLTWTGEHFRYTAGQYFPTEYRLAAGAVLRHYSDAVRPKLPPSPSDSSYSVDDIRTAAKRAGSHWFDKDSMRFFRSRVYPEVIRHGDLVYFISSEQFVDSDGRKAERKYSVRSFDCTNGGIGTEGEFQQYATKAQALRAARELAGETRQ